MGHGAWPSGGAGPGGHVEVSSGILKAAAAERSYLHFTYWGTEGQRKEMTQTRSVLVGGRVWD